MPTRLPRLWWIAFCLGLTAGQATADTLHIIELRHRPATEVQALIQPLLRADEGISGSGYRLFLRASESRRREIEQLVTTLDVASRQLTVTVRQGVAHDDRQARDAVSVEMDIGNRGRVVISGDASAAGARGQNRLSYRSQRQSSSADETHTQVLRVQDGQRAFIRVGQSAPVVERVLLLTGRREAVLAQGSRYQDFTTGFDLLPRVRGDRVQLEITPRLTDTRGADGSYRFQELQTTVTARLGEWIDVGELMGQSSEVNRAILAGERSQARERAIFSIKVE